MNNLPIADYEISLNDDPTKETVTLTLYVYGCPRKCDGCHNPDLRRVPKHIRWWLLEEVEILIENKLPLIESVTFCGGDFLPYYEKQLLSLILFCKNKNLKTILYTGEEYINISEQIKNNCNIIISGPYDNTQKTNLIPASLNQEVWINNKKINPINLTINQGVTN